MFFFGCTEDQFLKPNSEGVETGQISLNLTQPEEHSNSPFAGEPVNERCDDMCQRPGIDGCVQCCGGEKRYYALLMKLGWPLSFHSQKLHQGSLCSQMA